MYRINIQIQFCQSSLLSPSTLGFSIPGIFFLYLHHIISSPLSSNFSHQLVKIKLIQMGMLCNLTTLCQHNYIFGFKGVFEGKNVKEISHLVQYFTLSRTSFGAVVECCPISLEISVLTWMEWEGL